jgi:predicted RNA binding protein YcfA (HicA-like mRNA interferase family)
VDTPAVQRISSIRGPDGVSSGTSGLIFVDSLLESPVSERLPRIAGRDLLLALRRANWYEVRQPSGSHHHLAHPDRPGVVVTVAVHAGKLVPLGTLRAILNQAGLSADDLRRLL